ncbi:MAG: hypothetical protein K2X90_01150 [Candidatus Babeliaceae bacterium]|nr:hypothetical protein [Candidatus Babeliaceae bacterium]
MYSITKKMISVVLLAYNFTQLSSLTSQERDQVLVYCMSMAQQVGSRDVKFKLDNDQSYGINGEFRNSDGYYVRYPDPFISLSPQVQAGILEKSKNPASQKKISYNDYALFHELGHAQSAYFSKGCFISVVASSLFFAARPKISSLACSIIPSVILSFAFNKWFEERYADRFAARMMLMLDGYQKTKDYLNTHFRTTNSSAGYRSKEHLLRYVDQLQKWSKNPTDSSFFFNTSI